MNNKSFFIVIFILCLSFLIFSCESPQEIQENTVTQIDSTEFEILPTNTLNEKIIYTATSSMTPTIVSTFTPTPSITPTVIPSTTPTPTDVWRSSVVIEKFDLLRDERVENRFIQQGSVISSNGKIGLFFMPNDICELWYFDNEDIATYVTTFFDVKSGKFSGDGSVFALLGIDNKIKVYNRFGILESSFEDVIIDYSNFYYLSSKEYQLSYDGSYIIIVDEYEAVKLYSTKGIKIPNYYFVSYNEMDEIENIKNLLLRNHSIFINNELAIEEIKHMRNFATSGDLIKIFYEGENEKFNPEKYIVSVNGSFKNYSHYYTSVIDFYTNEKYGILLDLDTYEYLIWDYKKQEIILKTDSHIENFFTDNKDYNTSLMSYFLRYTHIIDTEIGSFLPIITEKGLEVYSFNENKIIHFNHFSEPQSFQNLEFEILGSLNRVITVSDGSLKLWTLDGKLIKEINDNFRIQSIEALSIDETKIVIQKKFRNIISGVDIASNISVLSSLTGDFYTTLSDIALTEKVDTNNKRTNVSSINTDLIQYYNENGVIPTLYLDRITGYQTIYFNNDGSRIILSSRLTDQLPIIYDFEKQKIISELPIQNVHSVWHDKNNDYIFISGEWFFNEDEWERSVTIWDYDGYLIGVLPGDENVTVNIRALFDDRILTTSYLQVEQYSIWRTLEGYPYDWQGTEGLDLSNYPYPIVTPTATFTITPRPTYTPTVTLTSTPTLTPSISPTPTMTLEFTLTPTVVPTETPRPKITPRAFGIEINESTHQYLHYQPNTVINFDYVINKTALSNDGKHVAVYTFDDDGFGNNDYHMVEVYDLAGNLELSFDWKCRYEEKGYDPMLTALSFSPDDSMLLLSDETGKIRLIDMDGKVLSIINLQKSSCNVENLAFYICEDQNLNNEQNFDPYGKCNASIDKTELYKAWAVIDVGFKAAYLEEPEYICPAFEGLEIEVVFSPNGKLIATLLDNVVTVWDLHGNKLYEYENYIISLSQLSFSPDSKYLLFTEERKAYLWDFEKDEIVEKFDVGDAIMNIEFVEDLEHFDLSINDDRNAERKAIEDFWFDEKNTSAEFVKVDYYDLVRPRYGVQIETQYSQIYVFDIEFDEDLHFGWGKGIIVYDAIFAPKQDLLVTEYASGALVWKDGLEEYVYNFHNPGYNTVMLKLHENERWLAMATWNDVVKIWDIKTGVLMSTLEFHDGPIKYVEFLEDTDQIITSSYDHRVVIWDHVK